MSFDEAFLKDKGTSGTGSYTSQRPDLNVLWAMSLSLTRKLALFNFIYQPTCLL